MDVILALIVGALFLFLIGAVVYIVWKHMGKPDLTPTLLTADPILGPVFGGGSPNRTFTQNLELTPAQEVPPPRNAQNALGRGTVRFANNRLEYNFSVGGLSSPLTAAHFHRGRPGVAGPIVRDIPFQLQNGVYVAADSFVPTQEFVNLLLQDELYVNFHTSVNPSGEVRGQLMLRA